MKLISNKDHEDVLTLLSELSLRVSGADLKTKNLKRKTKVLINKLKGCKDIPKTNS